MTRLPERDLPRLIEEITDAVVAALHPGPVPGCDDPCGGCARTCVTACADRVAAVVAAGAGRLGGSPGMGRPGGDVAVLIDHTLLRPEATEAEVRELCAEAAEHRFATVCVNPCWVELCARLLDRTPVRVCTVVGFPLGATLSPVKAEETRRVQDLGATEIDMVIPVGKLRSGLLREVRDDIAAVVAARRVGSAVKVIIECCLLTDAEKRTACLLAKEVGADWVKTSTGMSRGGATAADVALMREAVGPAMGVKAAGGIRDREAFDAMVRAGATRIGASAGVRILAEGR